jgi:hypothetical protein
MSNTSCLWKFSKTLAGATKSLEFAKAKRIFKILELKPDLKLINFNNFFEFFRKSLKQICRKKQGNMKCKIFRAKWNTIVISLEQKLTKLVLFEIKVDVYDRPSTT